MRIQVLFSLVKSTFADVKMIDHRGVCRSRRKRNTSINLIKHVALVLFICGGMNLFDQTLVPSLAGCGWRVGEEYWSR